MAKTLGIDKEDLVKKITDEESAMLIRKMKEISAFLKFEQIVEWIFAGIVIAVIAFGLLTLI